MIVIDSGLGGISVVRALKSTQPSLAVTYIADTASFPYGSRSPEDITRRAANLVRRLTEELGDAGPIVLACNTLSTLSLDSLRHQFPNQAFVGTVPAIKTAAQFSTTRRFTLLATPNTAAGRYTQGLINEFAKDCVVDCYGAPNLAAQAELMLLGGLVEEQALRQEILPAFCDDGLGRTDCLVLGCTHYPLVLEQLRAVAPWPVTFIDSSEAIARRALSLPDVAPPRATAYVTAGRDVIRYQDVFLAEGFEQVSALIVN